ncbi:16558_t:CDS:2 [Rhizophagus irregularis]|nr:16558_t:CDS:2 [Rhizophagus irregularis]
MAINSFKAFKVITTEERKRKLIGATTLLHTSPENLRIDQILKNNREKKKDNSRDTSNQNCKPDEKKDKDKKIFVYTTLTNQETQAVQQVACVKSTNNYI